MLVKELKQYLEGIDDNDEVSLYDLDNGERYYVDNIDLYVRNHFEINFSGGNREEV